MRRDLEPCMLQICRVPQSFMQLLQQGTRFLRDWGGGDTGLHLPPEVNDIGRPCRAVCPHGPGSTILHLQKDRWRNGVDCCIISLALSDICDSLFLIWTVVKKNSPEEQVARLAEFLIQQAETRPCPSRRLWPFPGCFFRDIYQLAREGESVWIE